MYWTIISGHESDLGRYQPPFHSRLIHLLTILQYTGPLAKMIGDYGGDVGDYIVVAVTILFYTLGRLVEIKVVGR